MPHSPLYRRYCSSVYVFAQALLSTGLLSFRDCFPCRHRASGIGLQTAAVVPIVSLVLLLAMLHHPGAALLSMPLRQ